MNLLDALAEARILAAQDLGELDDLPGSGAPLRLDDDSLIPPEWRMAYRVLRNAGCLPTEVTLRRELADLEALCVGIVEEDKRRRIGGRLQVLRTALAAQRVERAAWLDEADYRNRLVEKLDRRDEA